MNFAVEVIVAGPFMVIALNNQNELIHYLFKIKDTTGISVIINKSTIHNSTKNIKLSNNYYSFFNNVTLLIKLNTFAGEEEEGVVIVPPK